MIAEIQLERIQKQIFCQKHDAFKENTIKEKLDCLKKS